MDLSREAGDVLEAGALTIGGVAYPFTPMSGEDVSATLDEWDDAGDLERVEIVGGVMRAVLGREGWAAVAARLADAGDALDLEALVLAQGRALGASSRAAVRA